MEFTGILIGLGAKLPLYAFKKERNVVRGKECIGTENNEPPIDFLNSLLLGEVIYLVLIFRTYISYETIV